MIRSTVEKRAAFRVLHEQGCFIIPSPWDAGSARYLQGLGFKALATSSAGLAWSLGHSDGTIGLDAVLNHLRSVVEATDLPVNADFENGFAADLDGVAENVRRAVQTGIAGISIEDSTGDTHEPQFSIEVAAARLRAARSAIDAAGSDTLLVGRAENFFTGVPDLKDTVARIEAYAAAGADCLYASGIGTREQIAAVVAAAGGKPVNLLVGANSEFTLQEIAELGVRRVSVGAALAQLAWGGFMRTAQSLALGRLNVFGSAASGDQLNAFFRISSEQPLAEQPAHIIGTVEYRDGEGPLRTIPQGIVQVETSSVDAVLTWPDSPSHGLAAMPVANFCQYVADGMIIVEQLPPLP
jgi:2-methylisocitrate lyase-like PEP mutase family enzyme